MELRRGFGDDFVDNFSTSLSEEPGKEIFEALDLLPEHCTYLDEGCEFAISCLNCPFPNCIMEQPGGKQRWLNELRDKEIVRLSATKGSRTIELAQRFGISLRTVQRILRRAKSE